MRKLRSFPAAAAFTLIELMVSMTVLVLLVVLVNQLVFSTNTTTTNSRKHMDADNQARMVFDRMAIDFGKMVKRTDVDFLFCKQTGTTGGANDKMFFYSEAPAFFAPSGTSAAVSSSAQSTAALIGYRIHKNPDPNDPNKTKTIPQLERLGEGLTWDAKTSNDASATAADTAAGGMVFLSFPTSGTPAPATTLAGSSSVGGNWSKTTGTLTGNYDDGFSPNYHVFGDQVFRMEFAFLTKDGNVSTKPIRQKIPANWPSPGPAYYHEAAADPKATDDGVTTKSPYYGPGSRWFNTTTGRGYICLNSTTNAAIWNPVGIQDLSAIIVALAILDTKDRATLADANVLSPLFLDPTETQLSGAAGPPVTGPALMASLWSNTVNSASFASNPGVTRAAASQVRIYQRFFYLNTP